MAKLFTIILIIIVLSIAAVFVPIIFSLAATVLFIVGVLLSLAIIFLMPVIVLNAMIQPFKNLLNKYKIKHCKHRNLSDAFDGLKVCKSCGTLMSVGPIGKTTP